MKKLILCLVFLTLFSSCSHGGNTQNTEKRNKTLLAFLVYTQYNYKPATCRNYSGEANALFFDSQYSGKFTSDLTQYKTIVIGDSTMDISTRQNGYLSSTSESVAVSGNTLCDMTEQYTLSIKTLSPDYIMVASGGGNDLLRKIPNSNIVTTGQQLVDSLIKSYPNLKKLVWVGVHPTRVDYAQSNRGIVNSQMRDYVNSKGGCYVNPDTSFTIDAQGYPATSEMIDSIHYNSTPAFKIRTSAIGCGITL